MHRQGKEWRLPEIGIIALRNSRGIMTLGVEKTEQYMEHMMKYWGISGNPPERIMTFDRQASSIGLQRLNKPITPREVQCIAKKLKKEK